MAGDYHRRYDSCVPDCHTMHYSVSHNYTNGGAMPADTTLTTAGRTVGCSKLPTPNDLCMTCHDEQTFAPDVMGANTGCLRSRGGWPDTGAAAYQTGKATHSAPPSPLPAAWLLCARAGLECITCHDKHGGAPSRRRHFRLTTVTDDRLRPTASGAT